MPTDTMEMGQGVAPSQCEAATGASTRVRSRVGQAVLVLLGRSDLHERESVETNQLKVRVWFLENENGELEHRVSVAERTADELIGDLALMENRNHESKSTIAELESKCMSMSMSASRERARRPSVVLRDLPKDAVGVLDAIEGAFAGRVVFTERARVSASRLKRRERRYVDELYACLSALGDELLDLPPENMERAFESRTGFGLALTEGKMTKSDPKLMRLRQDEYEGVTLDITPHVKARVKNERLRVYFAVDRVHDRIIVGHVGEHLETYESKFLH